MNLIECSLVAVVITEVRLNSDGIVIRLIDILNVMFGVRCCNDGHLRFVIIFDTVTDIE